MRKMYVDLVTSTCYSLSPPHYDRYVQIDTLSCLVLLYTSDGLCHKCIVNMST